MFFFLLIFYGIIVLLSRFLSVLFPWAIPAGLLLNTGILALWLFRQKPNRLSFGELTRLSRKDLFAGLLCFLPVLLQLITGVPSHSFFAVLCIFLAAAQEELLFRGLLLPFLCKKGALFGVLVSSLIFAAAHFLNVENGAEIRYVLYQASFALAVGFALSVLTLFSKSILPGIGIHFLLNLTVNDRVPVSAGSTVVFWLSVLIYLFCGIFLLCKNHRIKERVFL